MYLRNALRGRTCRPAARRRFRSYAGHRTNRRDSLRWLPYLRRRTQRFAAIEGTNKSAGEALPPSKPLTGAAPPRRSVCTPGKVAVAIISQTACFKEQLS
jgi:hypothetical protein